MAEEVKLNSKREVEERINVLLDEIVEIYQEYNPDGDYLDLSIFPKQKIKMFNNRYYGEDAEHPINCFVKEGEVHHR